MVPSDPNHTPDPRPTGDLEQLFRQKFADAQVQPRTSLWSQIDHELLVQQNETYRRRLLVHRWVAAASVLLMMGSTTWFGLHSTPNTAPVAAVVTEAPAGRVLGSTSGPLGGAAGRASAERRNTPTASSAATGRATDLAAVGAARRRGFENSAEPMTNATAGTRLTVVLRDEAVAAAGRGSVYGAGAAGSPGTRTALGLTDREQGSAMLGAALRHIGFNAVAAVVPTENGLGNDMLLARPVALPGGLTAFRRPELLTPVPAVLLARATPPADSDDDEKLDKPRRWKLNVAYAASAFNPNANFSRLTAATTPAFNNAAPALPAADYSAYENAATEYRQQLRAGLGQRLAVKASYALGRHWALESGLEVAQQEASSQTSWNFLDGKSAAADFYEPAPYGSARRVNYHDVSYRYRTAGVPVGMRYTSGARQGWSVYARLGAAVSVLLGSRTELRGVPEATQVYSLASPESPYRKVLASVHGGGGLRFQPADASWALALGPDLQAGLTTLNADPAQRFLHQSRPYSLGVEASVEFGSRAATAAH